MDVTTASVTNCERSIELETEYLRYLCPFALLITVGLAFTVRRKHLFPNCCWQRPGFLHPIDFIDETDRRWTMVACFIVLVETVLSGETLNLVSIDIQDNPTRYKWVSVITKLISVLVVAIDYYPMFACVTHRQHIVCNIVGILYTLQLLILKIAVENLCPIEDGRSTIERYLRGAVLAYRLPAIISLFVIVSVCVFDLGKKIYLFWKSKQLEAATESSQFASTTRYSLMYVEQLVNAKTVPKSVDDTPATTVQRIKKRILNVLNFFRYRKIIGFKYSVRIVCTLAASAMAVIRVAVLFVVSFDSLWLSYIQWAVVNNYPNAFVEYLQIARDSTIVSVVVSAVIQLIFIFHMLIMYKRRVHALFQGIHKWHVQLTSSPSSMLLRGMRYSGYQVIYFVFGWLLSTLLIWVIVMLFAIYIVLPLRDGESSWILDILIQMLPVIALAVALHVFQLLLCKYVFLQNGGQYLALRNRRLYFFMGYYLFMYNAVIGLFSVMKRVLFSLVIGTFLIARLDYVLLMRGFERLDSGHIAYLSMLMVEVYHTHPVLRTFVELLDQTRVNRLERDTSVSVNEIDETLRRKRVRNRWYKTVTLINNPSLVFDRLMKRYQQEMEAAGGDKDDGFRLKNYAANLHSVVLANMDMRKRNRVETA